MMHDCAIETETQEPKDHLIDILLCNGPLHVPTFYSYTPVPNSRLIFGSCISVSFGVIHGIAWYYEFSSLPERWGGEYHSLSYQWHRSCSCRCSWRPWVGIVTGNSLIFSIFREAFFLSHICSRIALLIFPLITPAHTSSLTGPPSSPTFDHEYP